MGTLAPEGLTDPEQVAKVLAATARWIAIAVAMSAIMACTSAGKVRTLTRNAVNNIRKTIATPKDAIGEPR